MSFGIKKQQPKQGGKIKGPGTGTSDDVQKTVPNGTYIMPADSTAQIGEQNLEQLGQGKPLDVNVSNGEFEMTPEQVHAVGAQALDQMKDQTHTPSGLPQTIMDQPGEKPKLFFRDGGVVEDEWKRNLKTQSQPQGSLGAGQPRSGFNQPSTATALTDNKNIQFPTAQPKVNAPAVAPTQVSTQQVQPKEQSQSGGWGIGKTAKTFLAPEHDNGAWNPVGGLVNTATGLGKGLLGGAGALAAGAGEGARSTAAWIGGANNPNRGNMVAPGAEFSGQGFDQARLGMRQMFGLSGINSGTENQIQPAAKVASAVSSTPKNNAAQQKTNTAPSFNDQLNDAMYGSAVGERTAQSASSNVSPYAIQQKGNSFSYANPGAAAQARAAGIPELQSSGFAGGITPSRDPQGVKKFMANTREMGASEQQIQAAVAQIMNPQGQGFGAIRQPQTPQSTPEQDAAIRVALKAASTPYKGMNGELTNKQISNLFGFRKNEADRDSSRYTTDANNATSIQNNGMNNAASILQTGMREDGQNLRHGASLAQDNYQFNTDFGLKQRQQNLTEKKEGFGVRQAERAEKLYEMYDRAENDEQRQSIQARIDRLTGAKEQNGRDRYMAVGGGQEWDQNANVMINRPQQIFDTQTQQYLNTSPSSNSIPKPGEIREGYRYKGGDPSQQSSWEAV